MHQAQTFVVIVVFNLSKDKVACFVLGIGGRLRMRCEAIQTRPAGSNSEWLPIANLSPPPFRVGRLHCAEFSKDALNNKT